ncbi:hypothetical protein ACFPK6_14105 [Dokdonella soli]
MAVIDSHVEAASDDLVPYRLNLYRAEGVHAAATWAGPWSLEDARRVIKAQVASLACAIDGDTPWVVTNIQYAPHTDVFDLIPDALGTDETIVQRLRQVVDRIESRPLFVLLSDAFTLRTVFHFFWTCPASRAHHHAWRGGLASHSIEMAEWVAETPGLSPTDRDIGVAYALLHDLGKLWCYDEAEGERWERLGHELIGLAKLGDALNALDTAWPDGAIAMHSLLSGLWKTKGHKPLLAVGKLVQAYDQTSAEADLRGREGHRHQAWVPTPYGDNVRVFPVRA